MKRELYEKIGIIDNQINQLYSEVLDSRQLGINTGTAEARIELLEDDLNNLRRRLYILNYD